MITLNEEGMSEAEAGQKLVLLYQKVSSAVNAKEKFLKEIKSATPVNTQIRKQNNIIVDMEKVIVVWIEDQTNHNVPLTQSLIQSQAIALLNSLKDERGEEVENKSLKLDRLMRFKERSCLRWSSKC